MFLPDEAVALQVCIRFCFAEYLGLHVSYRSTVHGIMVSGSLCEECINNRGIQAAYTAQ